MGLIVDIDKDEVERFGDRMERVELLLQIVLAKLDPEAYQTWKELCALEEDASSFMDRRPEDRKHIYEERRQLLLTLLPAHKRPWEEKFG